MRESFKRDLNATSIVFKPCLVSSSNPSKQEFAQKSYREWLILHKFWLQKNISSDLKKEIDDFLNSFFEATNGRGGAINQWDFPITLEASDSNI